MSPPDRAAPFASSAGLPTDAGEPVFAEPWQAQAFALAVHLHAAGVFTWAAWSEALSEELKAADERGEADGDVLYYDHWLATLERLVTERGLAAPEALAERKTAWVRAYRRTPHGQPVVL